MFEVLVLAYAPSSRKVFERSVMTVDPDSVEVEAAIDSISDETGDSYSWATYALTGERTRQKAEIDFRGYIRARHGHDL